ncbi:EAL domain-containing protein [Parvibaculum sp.]|uniref:EAL domain-containing protein n=1 Tax=Parvibaculum sp. TaxID=2024848 RepID=UPI000C8E0326|nr:EAL domain-containing protein [Parvibaculum sp.]MAB13945.1 diguanylate phosphodiesterase [Parvibaculum sp.]
MPSIKTTILNGVATGLYIVPSIGVGYGLMTIGGFDPKLATLGGIIACLLGAEAHSAIARGIERKKVRKELDGLSEHAAQLAQDLDRAGDRIVELEERFERETQERMERIFSEIRVVESLVKRLAETRGLAMPGDAALPAENEAPRQAPEGDTPPPVPVMPIEEMDDTELLDTIRHSLETNRVDLYLQPIVTLPQRKAVFYEALSRLRTDEGALIMPRDYMRVAEPAGMMPTVDNILLFRCVQVVRKLMQRNSKAGIFCNISAFSLLDSDFFPQFIDYMRHNGDLAHHIIFEFSQSTVNGLGPLEQESLDALAELGFRFSMDQVTSLKFDPAQLYDRNFRFVKVSGQTLLDNNASGDIHAGDLKELLQRNGIQLIADKIEAEREVVNVLDLNAEYGQGYLFGEPRPVRHDDTSPVEAVPSISLAETAAA